MPAIAGPLVAAAGNMAGGYAASALMGDTSYPKGGGIEGLTSADAGKSGISPAVQIDPSIALEYFKKAGAAQEENYQKGLTYYEGKTGEATSALTASVLQANNTISKLAYAGDVSTEQYLNMLGINSRSPSYQSPDAVAALGPQYNSIVEQMRIAEQTKDPEQRAQLKAGINWALQNQQSIQLQQMQQAKDSALAQMGPAPTQADADKQLNIWKSNPEKYHQQILKMIDAGYTSAPDVTSIDQRNAINAFNRGDTGGANPAYDPNEENRGTMAILNENYTSRAAELGGNFDKQIADFTAKSQAAIADFNKNYSQNATYFANTPEETQQTLDDSNPALAKARKDLDMSRVDIAKPTAESLPNTPGYQFSLQQGQNAVMAAAAAGGMLSSGNTLTAMDKYSQGLAQQIYAQEMGFYLQGAAQNASISQSQGEMASSQWNSYMGALSTSMGQGNTATMQTAANEVNLGTNVAQLLSALGQGGMQTYQGIGDALAQSLYHQGDVQNMDNLENMKAQNSMIMQSNELSSQAGAQAGYLTLANNKFGAQQAQLSGVGSAGRSAGNVAGNWTLG